ncbi:elongation factor G [Anopheles sinensis]|uniref:Elongation factor G n=1 Tax=Anopheles sinensis TaxID=74873 RepID=A0A084VYD6_ANOSI|nr:elongation factor G [Anopheles sinensis]
MIHGFFHPTPSPQTAPPLEVMSEWQRESPCDAEETVSFETTFKALFTHP